MSHFFSAGPAVIRERMEGITCGGGDSGDGRQGRDSFVIAEDRDWWTERTSDRSAGWMQVIDRVYTYGRWQVHMIGVAEVSNPRE